MCALDQLDHLKIQVYEQELEKQEIEAINLRLQVNPHFILNCLNTIFSLTKTGNLENTRRFTKYLANYLRFTLWHTSGMVNLMDEMKGVEDYLEIQKIRYPNAFTYLNYIFEEAENARIPSLLIINFVENVVKHALTLEEEVEIIVVACVVEERLRITVCDTGNGMEPELLEHCRRLLPCGFLQGYGMTETTAAITMLLPEHHEHPRLLPTVGKAVPGMEIRIVDDEGRACAAGVPGEVLVRTDTLMLGYYRDPARTAEAVQDGWYRTGDIGFLDAEGFLTLVDRKNNLVISGGENVYPLEVSRCIKALAGVVDAVVAGVPDKRWGESLAAFVVRAEGSRISEADIVAHCARELGGYKKPHAVRFVDDLGRSASGKGSREQLEELKGLL